MEDFSMKKIIALVLLAIFSIPVKAAFPGFSDVIDIPA